jgi:hypothetical protein
MNLQTQRFCKLCARKTLHARESFSTGWAIFLTLITAGLFLLLLIPMKILEAFRPWRCQACGSGRML